MFSLTSSAAPLKMENQQPLYVDVDSLRGGIPVPHAQQSNILEICNPSFYYNETSRKLPNLVFRYLIALFQHNTYTINCDHFI